MNVYEAMRKIMADGGSPDYVIEKLEGVINELVAAYDALAPEPKAWSIYHNAHWYVINPDGGAVWFDDEPEQNEWRWTNEDWFNDVGYETGRKIKLPIGIDWRLCKWQRPEVK